MEAPAVIELVRKLLAKAESVNEEEAALFAAKAQELLLKYNLDSAVLAEEEKPEATKLDIDVANDKSSWVGVLYNGIARSNGCYVVQTTYRRPDGHEGHRFHVFGRQANIEVVQYLGAYLYREIRRLSRPKGVKTVSAWRNAFRHGATVIVINRLSEGMRQFASSSDATKALVVVLDSEAMALRDKMFPKLGKSRTSSVNAAGFNAGVRAGKDIALNRGIRSNAAGQLLLK